MNTQTKPYLLYLYLGIFLLSSYFLRDIFVFAQSNINLIFKIILFFVLGYAYKNILPYGKLSSGILFVLFLMVGWELSNFLPLISLYLFMLLPVVYKYSLGVEWFVFIKPLGVLIYLWCKKESFVSYINALTAQNSYTYVSSSEKVSVENTTQNKENSDFNVFSTKKLNNHIQRNQGKSYFFVNEKTKLVTVFYKKNKFFFSQLIFTNEKKFKYFFLNNKKKITPSIKNIVLNDNKLLIKLRKNELEFNVNDLNSDLKKDIKFLKEADKHDDNYLSIY